jgi:hypothetical protein
MTISAQRVTVPTDVLVRVLDGEAVLLSLTAESYFGLDAVGTHIWHVVTSTVTLEEALARLLDDYPDVEPAQLRTDFNALIEELVGHGLLVLHHT